MKRIFSTTNLIYLLLIVFGTFVLFKPSVDPDFGWHYKYGEYFIQHGQILRDNIFSYTNTSYRWANSYWVAELIMYLSHHFLGSVFSTLILSVILGAFLLNVIKKQTRNLTNLSINYILISLSLSIYVLTVRPLYYSTIFIFLLLYVLIYRKDWINFLPFIFVVWANMHADFVLALFIFGVYCLDGWIKKTTQIKDVKKVWSLAKSFWDSFKVLFLCTLSTLLNPYGIKLWITLAGEVTQPIKSFVKEWGTIDFRLNDPRTLFIIIVSAMGLISGFLVFKRKKDQFGWWYKILIIFFYLFSVKASYFGRIFFILSSFAIIQELGVLIDDLALFFKNKKTCLPKVSLVFLLSLLIFDASSLFVKNIYLASDVSRWSVASEYPYNALVYIKKNPMAGNMWNIYRWGGYLVWQLPQYKTFIDGRMATWSKNGNSFMNEYVQISQNPEKNSALINSYLSEYNIRWVLDKPNSIFVKYLLENSAQNSQWKTVYEDDIAVIIQKQ